MKTRIEDCEIGEIYYRLSQLSMWECNAPDDYIYYEKYRDDVFRFQIHECIKLSKQGAHFRVLQKDDITDEIKTALKIKED